MLPDGRPADLPRCRETNYRIWAFPSRERRRPPLWALAVTGLGLRAMRELVTELAGELRIDRGTGGGTMLEAERRADRKCCLRIAVACSPARWTPLGRASPG